MNICRIRKAFIFFLATAIVIANMGMTAFAAERNIETEDQNITETAVGPFIIKSETALEEGVDYTFGKLQGARENEADTLTIFTCEPITIANKENKAITDAKILIDTGDKGTAEITLSNVNIDLTGYARYDGKNWAMKIASGTPANIILDGENTLKGGSQCAGLNIPVGASAVIDGTGKLNAAASPYFAAAIGGNDNESAGNITIAGGEIHAKGAFLYNQGIKTDIGGGGNGNYGPAGSQRDGGVIRITGGIVYADDIGNGRSTTNDEAKGNGVFALDGGVVFTTENGVNCTWDKDVSQGVIFLDNSGTAYGTEGKISEGLTLTVPAGKTLTIPEGAVINNYGTIVIGGNLTNNGKLYDGGKIEGTVQGNQPQLPYPVIKEVLVTSKTITVLLEDEGQSYGGAEYKLNEQGEWQASNVFEGLSPDQTSNVYVRYKGNDTYGPSEEQSISVTTKKEASQPQLPENLEGRFGQTLGDIILSEGWQWVDTSTELYVGKNSYPARLYVDDETFDYSGIEGYDQEGHYVERNLTVNVLKAVPEYEMPESITIVQGSSLSSVEIPDDDNGSFQWKDGSLIADTLGESYFEAIFVPKDSENYQSVDVLIKVDVIPAASVINSIPQITAEDKQLTEGDHFEPLKEVTAYDKEDGDITSSIQVVSNNVDTNKAGQYKVVYKVFDSQGASSEKSITVSVIAASHDNHAVKTSDEMKLLLWIGVLAVAVIAAIVLIIINKKRKK